MSVKVVVDASVWVSQLMPADAHYQASKDWAERFTDSGNVVVMPAFLIIEVAASVSRVTKQPDLSKAAIAKINSSSVIEVIAMDSAFIQVASGIAADLRLRAGDATYVALAYQLNIPLISWDKEQLERASSLVTTFTPDTYVFEADEEETETGA